MSLGFFVSIFGILQHLTFNGKLYWFRVMRYGGLPFGPYVNRNHFAGFAELLIPIALVPLVLGKVRRERLLLVALFALVPIVALLLSASRGGIISLAVQITILFLLLLVRRVRSKHILVGGMVVLCAVLAVSWIGVQQVLQRFTGLQSLEVSEAKRAAMRADTWQIFLDHPLIGTGLGTSRRSFRVTIRCTTARSSITATTTTWRRWRKRASWVGCVALGFWGYCYLIPCGVWRNSAVPLVLP